MRSANPVSVVIPTFDRPRMLRETLSRLTDQTTLPKEVIVVDNGMTPCDPLEQQTYPFKLRYYRICSWAGSSQARNFGVALAKGSYIAFLDDDDFWERDYLERLLTIIRDNSAAPPAMIVGRVDHLENGERHFFRFAGDVRRLESCFYFNPGYLGSVLTVEKSTFLRLGGFDPTFRTGQDRELAIRYMINNCHIVYDADLISINRVHDNNISREIDHVESARLLLRKYRRHIGFKIHVRAWREAYKKTRKRRYLVHKLLLKVVLIFASVFPASAVNAERERISLRTE